MDIQHKINYPSMWAYGEISMECPFNNQIILKYINQKLQLIHVGFIYFKNFILKYKQRAKDQ